MFLLTLNTTYQPISVGAFMRWLSKKLLLIQRQKLIPPQPSLLAATLYPDEPEKHF